MSNINAKGYFYLNVTEELKEDCTKAKLFKFTKENTMIMYNGWMWIGDGFQWSPKNYTGNTCLYVCGPCPNISFKNMVWFDMTNEEYSKMSDIELENIALGIIIVEETNKLEVEKQRVKNHENKIDTLKELRKSIEKM
jgi:hypothetical protein